MEWKRIAAGMEMITGLAVVASLAILIQEVRLNTRAVERQAAVDRAASMSTPFFESEALRTAMVKVDVEHGGLPVLREFVDRYGFTEEEAIVWHRHLIQLWGGLEADWYYGERELVRETLRALLIYPDQRIYAENEPFGTEFAGMVRELLAESGG